MKGKSNSWMVMFLFAAVLFFAGGTIDAQAASVGSGSGEITSANRTRSYSLTLPSSGRINLVYDSEISQSEIYIEDQEDQDREIVWRQYPNRRKNII